MKTITDLAPSYDEAYDSLKDKLHDLRREVNAFLLAEYPNREFFLAEVEALRNDMGVDETQVNVILEDRQITIVSTPSGTRLEQSIPDEHSLCVLTAGSDESLAVEDIKNAESLAGHPAQKDWGAWASTPVDIHGFAAGSVCALDLEARTWTADEEQQLITAAESIAREVERWSKLQN